MTRTSPRLPVWQTVIRSYGYVWQHFRLFALPIFLVFVIGLICSLAIVHFQAGNFQAIADGNPPKPPFEMLLASAAFSLVVTIVSAAFVVGVHRTVLLDETHAGLDFFRWDRNFLRYLGTMLMIVVLVVLGLVILGLFAAAVAIMAKLFGGGVGIVGGLTGLATIALYVIGLILLQRLSLSFPAAALGETNRFALSWKATRGSVLRLIAIGILVILPYFILSGLVALPQMIGMFRAIAAHTPPIPPTPSLVATVVSAAIKAFVTPVFAVMLSLCYDVLVRGGGPENGITS